MTPEDFLAKSEDKWTPEPPAPSGAVEAMAKESDLSLPADYLKFLTLCNGGDGFLSVQPNYLRLWAAEEVVGNNRDYQMPDYVPGFFGFGDAGGGDFFAFDTRGSQPWPIVSIPFVPMNPEDAIAVADSFAELLGHVCSSAPESA